MNDYLNRVILQIEEKNQNEPEYLQAVKEVFDCSPAGIIKTLDLLKPVYSKTASYGHFGRNEFTWEKTDKVEEIKNAIK